MDMIRHNEIKWKYLVKKELKVLISMACVLLVHVCLCQMVFLPNFRVLYSTCFVYPVGKTNENVLVDLMALFYSPRVSDAFNLQRQGNIKNVLVYIEKKK